MSEYQNTIGAGFDYLTAGTQPSEKGVAPAQKNTLRLYDLKGDPANIGRGEITVYSFAEQGNNHPEGDFSQHANGFAWSTLATSKPGELFPSPAAQSDNPVTPTGNFIGLHSAYAFSTLFLGIGSGANVSLLKATGADPTLSAVTWSPGASVCSMARSLTSGAERLVVGRIGAAAVRFSDAAGTVGETMHADTNSMWGMIPSGINATTAGVPVQLIYAGTSIKTKATDADQTTALVATVPPTTVNAGGFAIGAIKAAGRSQRAYWAIPKVSNTNGALKFGAEALMEIKSTDMTGSDLLPVDLKYLPNGILGAVPFRDGILAHDGYHVVYWDGDDEYDLGIFRRRVQSRDASNQPQTTNVIDSDDLRRIRQLVVNGPECGVVYESVDGTGTIFPSYFFEVYNFESGSWHNAGSISSGLAASASPALVLSGGGGAAISPDSRYFYAFDQASPTRLRWWFVPRPGESLLWQNSLGSGGSITTSIPTYGTGTTGGSMLGCRWWLDEPPPGALPGTNTIRRMPKVITEVEFNGNLDHGGAGAWTFQVKVQGRGVDGTTTYTAYDETFSQGKTSADYRKRNSATKRANIQDVQLYLVASSSPGLRQIPSLLPFTVRFAYSKDGSPITSLPEDAKQR